MKLKRTVVLSLALIALFTVGEALAQDRQLTGSEVVQKMAEQYANAKSYQDEGVVQNVKPGSSAPEIEPVNSFKTYFVRPDKIRFEWVEKNFYGKTEQYIIWSDGEGVFSDYPFGSEKAESIGMAVAGATGISRGAAHLIPVLLNIGVNGFRVTKMENLSLLREEEVEGEICFVVRGDHPFGFPIDLWISKKDFLLRKQREKNDDGSFDEDIRRNVKLNGQIPVEAFRHSPSKKDSKTDSTLTAAANALFTELRVLDESIQREDSGD